MPEKGIRQVQGGNPDYRPNTVSTGIGCHISDMKCINNDQDAVEGVKQLYPAIKEIRGTIEESRHALCLGLLYFDLLI